MMSTKSFHDACMARWNCTPQMLDDLLEQLLECSKEDS